MRGSLRPSWPSNLKSELREKIGNKNNKLPLQGTQVWKDEDSLKLERLQD